jgi:hypothetical protein
MENIRFKIIFDKLSTDLPAGFQASREVLEVRDISVQADEIAELRQLVAEVTEQEPQLYTIT